MASFTAIKVGQGDAFFLERQGKSILVDGGRSRRGFPAVFQEEIGVQQIDILVCTHNDADHANGVLGLLEAGVCVREIWLPGSWLGPLAFAHKTLPKVLQVLAQEVCDVLAVGGEPLQDGFREIISRNDVSVFEALEEFIDEFPPSRYADDKEIFPDEFQWDDESSVTVAYDIDEVGTERWPSLWFERSLSAACVRTAPKPIDFDLVGHVFVSAVLAFERIRQIAETARQKGIPVRWFQLGEPDGPRYASGLLEPLNSKELTRPRVSVGSNLFRLLVLSASNKRSLVFWSPADDAAPGLLLTADSDLQGIALPPALSQAVVTAPHHGSEANREAYLTIESETAADFDDLLWVRSDGRFKNRPGSTYLELNPARRYCTICNLRNGHSTRKASIRLRGQSGVWQPGNNTCQCR